MKRLEKRAPRDLLSSYQKLYIPERERDEKENEIYGKMKKKKKKKKNSDSNNILIHLFIAFWGKL